MKIKYLSIVSCVFALGLAHAESRWFDNSKISDSPEFRESRVDLPAVPDAKDDAWFELYISPTHRGTVWIRPESVQTAEDGSIRYVLNQRSAAGYDNISAEGLLCITGNKLLGSDGSQVKIFGYADTDNKRWIEPRQSEWTVIGGKLNSNDRIRRVLYDTFCIEGKAKNDEELRQRLQKEAGRQVQKDYSK